MATRDHTSSTSDRLLELLETERRMDRENSELRSHLQCALVLVEGALAGNMDRELAEDWLEAISPANEPVDPAVLS